MIATAGRRVGRPPPCRRSEDVMIMNAINQSAGGGYHALDLSTLPPAQPRLLGLGLLLLAYFLLGWCSRHRSSIEGGRRRIRCVRQAAAMTPHRDAYCCVQHKDPKGGTRRDDSKERNSSSRITKPPARSCCLAPLLCLHWLLNFIHRPQTIRRPASSMMFPPSDRRPPRAAALIRRSRT